MGTGSPLVRPSRVRFGVLAFACTLSLITYLDRVCISRVQEDIQRDLDVSDKALGIVFGAFVVGYALFEVPGGWLGDRWGARRVLTGIVIWWSVFTMLSGCVWRFTLDSGRSISFWRLEVPLLLNGLVVMVLVRFLFGAGEAGAFPNLARVVKDWFPYRERALAQGAIWMSARLGGAFAPVVIGSLSVALGWRPAFWTLGLLGLFWAVAFYFWFRDRPEEQPGCNAAEIELIRSGLHDPPLSIDVPVDADKPWRGDAPSQAVSERQQGTTPANPAASGVRSEPPAPVPVRHEEPAHGRPPLRPMLTSVTMWALCAAAIFVNFGWYFYPTWQPRYLKEVHHISFEDSEIITGLPFLCGAFGALVGGGVSDKLVRRIGRRWGRSLVGLVGFTGAGLCVLATGFVAEAWQAVVLLCLAFLVNDLAIPVIWAVSADVGGRFVGTVAGIMNMAGGIGAFLSPLLIPYVLAALPEGMGVDVRWRLIFVGLAAAWFVAAVAWLFVDAARPLFDRR
jgi:MFS family permease